jgi:hypothetical protein
MRVPSGKTRHFAFEAICRTSLRGLASILLVSLLSREAASSTVTPVSVPLSKVVSDSRLIVIASVERVENFDSGGSGKNQPGLKYFEVRIEQILKSTETAPKDLRGTTIAVFDPQEKFYRDHADLIAAGVISFADPKYPTKVQQIAAGDRLLFFLTGRSQELKLPRLDAYFLVCGRAYDRVGLKPAVMRRLK